MDFREQEERDGVRFSWNIWPGSKAEAEKAVIPIGCLYTPLKSLANMPVLGYDPVPCKHCGGILNPYWCVPNS
jgi:protein transport protein SEC23